MNSHVNDAYRALQRLRVESCAASADADAEIVCAALEDAQRWRSLMACERIRVIGGADLGTPNALLGLDFHKKHPARDDAESRKMFLAFVDGGPK